MGNEMKQQIIKLLEKHADEQGNLASPWLRAVIAEEVLAIFSKRINLMQKALEEGDIHDSSTED
tara:strand:- start:540 stop:731 length:192 start_codon:yes stop_codon:yes gene_type:complete